MVILKKLNRFPVRYRDLIQSRLDGVTILFHVNKVETRAFDGSTSLSIYSSSPPSSLL